MGTQEVSGRVPTAPGSQPSASAAGASSPTGADPSRGVSDIDRLTKFCAEWRKLMGSSGYGSAIYELHPGSDDRSAICDVYDIEALLRMAAIIRETMRRRDSAGRETASPSHQVSETPSDTLGEKA